MHLLAERQRSRVTRRCCTLQDRRTSGDVSFGECRVGSSGPAAPAGVVIEVRDRRARIVLRRAPWQWKPGRRGYTVHTTRHEEELIKITTVGAVLMGRRIGTRLVAGGNDGDLIDTDPEEAERLALELLERGGSIVRGNRFRSVVKVIS